MELQVRGKRWFNKQERLIRERPYVMAILWEMYSFVCALSLWLPILDTLLLQLVDECTASSSGRFISFCSLYVLEYGPRTVWR